jgi:hypothetical protein
MRAFYAAESGYRYAVGEYLQLEDEGMKSIITRMEEIHNNERTLPNSIGAFNVSNRPYFFITTNQAYSGDTSLSVRTPGEFPSDFTIPDDVWILIDGESDLTQTETNIQTGTDSITLELSESLTSDLSVGTIIYLGAIVSGVDGDTLTLDSDVTSFFPEDNGGIEVLETVYTYDACERHGNELTGIDGLDASISSGDYVLLRPMVQLDVTGKPAGGGTGGVFDITREITYLVSITTETLMVGDGGNNGNGDNGNGNDNNGGGPPGDGAPGWGGRGGDGTDWSNPDWDNPGGGDPGWSDPDWDNQGNDNPGNGNNGSGNSGNGNNGNGGS